MADPNWLLSSTAQSGAALVAIVGGFLVSRVITLSSERQNLERRVREVEDDLAHQQEALAAAEHALLAEDVEDFLDAVRDDLVSSEGALALEEAVREHGGGRTPEELRPFFEDEVLRVCRALEVVDTHVADGNDLPVSPDALDASLSLEDWSLLNAVLKHRHSQRPTTIAGMSDYDLRHLGRIHDSTMDAAYFAADRARYDRIVEDVSARRAAISHDERALVALDIELARVAKPVGVKQAVWVLSYFAVAGVLVPIGLMAAQPESLSVAIRVLVVALFTTGVVALLGYLLWLVRRSSDA